MDHNLFHDFAPLLRRLTEAELRLEIERPERLQIEAESCRGKRLQVAYAPFDYVNPDARIVIVGLTPGRQQMTNALFAAKRSLAFGASEAEAQRAAKVFASFSGPMRTNLVALLDHIGVQRLVGIPSTTSLWAQQDRLVHFTSALRYPVFVDNENYSGNPAPVATAILQRHLMRWLAGEMRALPNALFVPLGSAADESVNAVAKNIGFNARQILSGLPHPSGANAERIAFFLGRKIRSALSSKVNPDKIEASREQLLRNIAALDQAALA